MLWWNDSSFSDYPAELKSFVTSAPLKCQCVKIVTSFVVLFCLLLEIKNWTFTMLHSFWHKEKWNQNIFSFFFSFWKGSCRLSTKNGRNRLSFYQRIRRRACQRRWWKPHEVTGQAAAIFSSIKTLVWFVLHQTCKWPWNMSMSVRSSSHFPLQHRHGYLLFVLNLLQFLQNNSPPNPFFRPPVTSPWYKSQGQWETLIVLGQSSECLSILQHLLFLLLVHSSFSCVCVCMCVCKCMFVCVCACVYTYMYVCVCMFMRACMCVKEGDRKIYAH